MSANEIDRPGLVEEDAGRAAVEKRLLGLEKEYLKKEILEELRGDSAGKGTSVTQNPAFLLLLGFLLTGVVGTWFTSFWQSRQQEIQRAQQVRERDLQQKYEVSDQINKAVAEIYTATNVMLNPLIYTPGTPRMLDKEIAEREVFWIQSIRAWLVNSQTLKQKLTTNFKSEKAQAIYGEILDNRKTVSIEFNNIMPELKRRKLRALKDAEVLEKRDKILALTNGPDGLMDKLERLMKVMTEEIQSEEGPGPAD